MVSNFHMPPTGFGPGSQTHDEGEELDYMALPSGMRTYVPHTPEVEDTRAVAPALALLTEIAAACDEAARTGLHAEFDLGGLGAASRALMAETLGEGEVSMKLHGIPALRVQESVFAGVWVLHGEGTDLVEVGPVPQVALTRAFNARRPGQGAAAAWGPGVVNAPPILAELTEKSGVFQRGQDPHVVNLTLLPHTEDDLLWLDAALGEGSTVMLSRGYGNCRVTATAMDHVWRVQFFNSMDTLILDTFEVTELPEVVRAAPEDLGDSGGRLRAVVESIS